MRNLKKLGILTSSTVLSIGILAPTISAETHANEQREKAQIRVSSTESVVTKSTLIEKFKEVFPDKFNSLNLDESDFHMNSSHHYPNDDTIRYDLNFHKIVDGKDVNGGIGFRGENLEVENFHFDPANATDALFPAALTKQEAEEVALDFISKFSEESEYQLDTDQSLYPGNQTLTEPIRYSFSFLRTENEVPISDQRMHVVVLGNGEIVQFSRSLRNMGDITYDDVADVQDKDEILTKVKENLAIDLRYQIDSNPQTGDRDVKLVYQPTSEARGVHAISGEWQTPNGFSSDFPEEKEIDMLTDEPIEPKQTDFSLEDAKTFAKELLSVDSDKVTLSIQSIDERKNHTGQDVISIQYMYQYANGGRGTSLELNKETGEIIQYHDIKSEVLKEIGEDSSSEEEKVSSNAALDQAVEYLKEFAPSYLHNYARPIGQTPFEDERGVYHFSFPRVVNGILVSGDHLSVQVSADGSLLGLNVRQQQVEDWPSSEEIISKEEAKNKFINELRLDLRYINERNDQDENHYNLVYTPVFNEETASFIDANTGEWSSRDDEESDRPAITHPWAEDELNYLINAGILDVENVEEFDANAKLTKGDAIEIIMKSLTRFYEQYHPAPGQENKSQSFENISPDHSLYQVIERAVTMGILDAEKETFDLDDTLTREELSVWYVRAIGLEKAAENSSIYQTDFEDVNNIQAENIGYVALAHSLGLLTANNNHFNPNQEVTYAQLAVSSVRLGHEVYEGEPQRYY